MISSRGLLVQYSIANGDSVWYGVFLRFVRLSLRAHYCQLLPSLLQTVAHRSTCPVSDSATTL